MGLGHTFDLDEVWQAGGTSYEINLFSSFVHRSELKVTFHCYIVVARDPS